MVEGGMDLTMADVDDYLLAAAENMPLTLPNTLIPDKPSPSSVPCRVSLCLESRGLADGHKTAEGADFL